MGKFITREITFTTIEVAKLEKREGKQEVVEIEPIEVEGNVSDSKALKMAIDKHGLGVVVTSVESTTEKRQMETMKFKDLAEKVEEKQNDDQPKTENPNN